MADNDNEKYPGVRYRPWTPADELVNQKSAAFGPRRKPTTSTQIAAIKVASGLVVAADDMDGAELARVTTQSHWSKVPWDRIICLAYELLISGGFPWHAGPLHVASGHWLPHRSVDNSGRTISQLTSSDGKQQQVRNHAVMYAAFYGRKQNWKAKPRSESPLPLVGMLQPKSPCPREPHEQHGKMAMPATRNLPHGTRPTAMQLPKTDGR